MRHLLSLLYLPLLISCGGSDKSAVFDVSALDLKYGASAIILFVGSYVGDQGLKTEIPNCSSQIPVTSTPTQYAVRCVVNKTGDMHVRVTNAVGEVVFSKVLNVPAPQVSFDTSKGKIVAELNPNAAPLTVNNFLGYVQSGFYTNTLFHRVVPDFVIQGGGFVSGMTPQQGEGKPITLESSNGLSNLRGTLAMARTTAPDSATSQFFFNLKDNAKLDYQSADKPGYAVFGKIVQGLDVMDRIGAVQTSMQAGQADVPVEEIIVKSVTRIQ